MMMMNTLVAILEVLNFRAKENDVIRWFPQRARESPEHVVVSVLKRE
jgi:hypothetical protein